MEETDGRLTPGMVGEWSYKKDHVLEELKLLDVKCGKHRAIIARVQQSKWPGD